MPRISSVEGKTTATGKMKWTVRFEGDQRYIGYFADTFPFKVGEFISCTIKQDKSGKYWNMYDAVLSHEPMADPMAGHPFEQMGYVEKPVYTPQYIPPKVEYSRSADLCDMDVAQLKKEKIEAAVHNANVAYLGQIDNLIVQRYVIERLDKQIALLEKLVGLIGEGMQK